MAHFAEVDDNNVVLRVLVVDDTHESRGEEFLRDDCGLGGRWLKTSYNSAGGKRLDPTTREPVSDNHYRFNFAGPGYVFDPNVGPDGAFIPPKPMPFMQVSSETALWEAIPGINPMTGNAWSEDELFVQQLIGNLPTGIGGLAQ